MSDQKNVKQPQDHKPKVSETRAEVEGAPLVVEHDGATYEIDRANANNLELMEFAEDGLYLKAIRGYIGLDQWAAFKDKYRDEQGRVDADAFEPFLDAVMRALGNSPASSGS
jgi:hypothetical protein